MSLKGRAHSGQSEADRRVIAFVLLLFGETI